LVRPRRGVCRLAAGRSRRAADEFLNANAHHLGKRSTADLDVLLQEC